MSTPRHHPSYFRASLDPDVCRLCNKHVSAHEGSVYLCPDLPPEAFGVELDPLPPWAREKQALAEADRVIHTYETEALAEAAVDRMIAEAVAKKNTRPIAQNPLAALLGDHDRGTVGIVGAAVDAFLRANTPDIGPGGEIVAPFECGIAIEQIVRERLPMSPALPPDAAALIHEARAAVAIDIHGQAHVFGFLNDALRKIPALCDALDGALVEVERLKAAPYRRSAADQELFESLVATRHRRDVEITALRDAHAREREGLLGDVAHARAETAQAKAEIERLTRDREAAELAARSMSADLTKVGEELDRMRPVVEAAECFVDADGIDSAEEAVTEELFAAVEEYRKAQEGTPS